MALVTQPLALPIMALSDKEQWGSAGGWWGRPRNTCVRIAVSKAVSRFAMVDAYKTSFSSVGCVCGWYIDNTVEQTRGVMQSRRRW